MTSIPFHAQKENRVDAYDLGGLAFFGLLPCPVKVPFEDRFRTFARDLYTRTGKRFDYFIEANSNHHTTFHHYLRTVERADQLPDMLLIPGYNTFFEKNFQERFIRTGVFADHWPYEAVLLQNGMRDPQGNCTLLAMNSLIIAVDTARAPFVPESWGDLLDERLAGQVVIRGDGKTYCDALLTYFHKNHGEDGIRRLAGNVREGLHPAQMAKNLTQAQAGSPSVYVMPYFYAQMVSNPHLCMVWPTEGTLLNPVFLLVKADKAESCKEILDFLTGPESAAAFNCAGFFGTAAGADATMPKDKAYNWIGWDYLYHAGSGEMLGQLNPLFLRYYREKQ